MLATAGAAGAPGGPDRPGDAMTIAELQATGRSIASTERLETLPTVLDPAPSRAYTLALEDERRRCRLKFSTPVPALRLCQAFGWARPYGTSGDVHQVSWKIRQWDGDLPDPYGPRIKTITPRLGRWALDVALTDRPQGVLPNLSAGASPAYDLSTHAADVASIEIRPFDPNLDS